MSLATQRYVEQVETWPREGRCILAHYDDSSIVVYQAYRPETGRFAAEHGYFGNGFSYDRMSWIKPNFLWMMYRSGWGAKEGQEVVLALRLRRTFFDELLGQAVQSSFHEGHFASREAWSEAVANSSVRLQWDPDHDPYGAKMERRAIQLGLRGDTLRAYGKRELLEVNDVSEFVAAQHQFVKTRRLEELLTPVERVYTPSDPAVAARLGLT